MEILFACAGLIVGAAVGWWWGNRRSQQREGKEQAERERLLFEARTEAERLVKEARAEAEKERSRFRRGVESETAALETARAELEKARQEIQREQQQWREEQKNYERSRSELDRRREGLERREKEIHRREEELQRTLAEQKQLLEKVAGMSGEEAKKQLLDRLSQELDREAAARIRKRTQEAAERAEQEARRIITLAIHRFAAPHTADSTTSLIVLPNDEMKGRVIGREGRNIRVFEKETGVDVIIDETPGTITLSSFDGVRREIARRTMERLCADGRIHPARIEEVVEQVKREMEGEIQRIGKQFLQEMEIPNVHPKLVTLVGRLSFRSSYGQNVLQHVREVAHLCGVMAAELGYDERLARRCGVFHDIGKAVDHTFEGSHPMIGGDLLRRFGEAPEVVEAAEHHHSDPNTVQYPTTVLAAAADAISASRPGARGEGTETYVRRIEKLEGLAKSMAGVAGAYAVHAGRELRVLVSAEQVSDDQAVLLARNLAKKIEEQLTYPGEIKVTVLREKRIVEYAR